MCATAGDSASSLKTANAEVSSNVAGRAVGLILLEEARR